MSGTDVSFRPKGEILLESCTLNSEGKVLPNLSNAIFRQLTLNSWFLHADGRLRDILGNRLDVPQPGKFEPARAANVGLLDIEQQALQHFRFFIRVENFKADSVQIRSFGNLDFTVDPDRVVVPWNKKYQPDLRIGFDIP